MAFDTMKFVLNYPHGSDVVITEVSSNNVPSESGMLRVKFHDGAYIGAEAAAYVLTKNEVKQVSELTSSDYVGFVSTNVYVGSFAEHLQGQQLRYFLVNPHVVFSKVHSVEFSPVGSGLPYPIVKSAANGGIQGDDYPCMCVLFSDSCGTKLNTTTISFN